MNGNGPEQVRMLFKLIQSEKNFGIAAMKAGMDEKTARKYCKTGKLSSELKQENNWRTRKDPFGDLYPEGQKLGWYQRHAVNKSWVGGQNHF